MSHTYTKPLTEDILGLPNCRASFAKHIGSYNASLIRTLIAEASLTSEVLRSPKDLFFDGTGINNSKASRFVYRASRASLAAELSLAAKSPLAAETYQAASKAHISKFHISAFIASFGIDFGRLRMLAICMRPCDETDFDRKAAGVNETAEGWVKMRNAELEKVVEGIVEREGGWLRRVPFADVEKRVCFEWVTPWAGRQWLLYDGNCDD